MTTNGSAATDKAARRKRFEDVFPVIAEELLGYIKGEGMPKDAVEWYEKVCQFCSPLTFLVIRPVEGLGECMYISQPADESAESVSQHTRRLALTSLWLCPTD
jgi:hypothetical protein